MSKNKAGWAVELIGEKIDVDEFGAQLALPFDPWTEEYQSEGGVRTLLRSAQWNQFTEAVDVFWNANRMIQVLNGAAMLIHNDAKSVCLGKTIKFGLDGKLVPIIFAATGTAQAMARARGRSIAIIDGASNPLPESKLQKWYKEAETDDTRLELFVHLSRMDNWFDLYKSIELTETLVGGEPVLLKTIGSDGKKWENISRTANCYRHAPGRMTLPPKPAEWEDARNFLLGVILTVI